MWRTPDRSHPTSRRSSDDGLSEKYHHLQLTYSPYLSALRMLPFVCRPPPLGHTQANRPSGTASVPVVFLPPWQRSNGKDSISCGPGTRCMGCPMWSSSVTRLKGSHGRDQDTQRIARNFGKPPYAAPDAKRSLGWRKRYSALPKARADKPHETHHANCQRPAGTKSGSPRDRLHVNRLLISSLLTDAD